MRSEIERETGGQCWTVVHTTQAVYVSGFPLFSLAPPLPFVEAGLYYLISPCSLLEAGALAFSFPSWSFRGDSPLEYLALGVQAYLKIDRLLPKFHHVTIALSFLVLMILLLHSHTHCCEWKGMWSVDAVAFWQSRPHYTFQDPPFSLWKVNHPSLSSPSSFFGSWSLAFSHLGAYWRFPLEHLALGS